MASIALMLRCIPNATPDTVPVEPCIIDSGSTIGCFEQLSSTMAKDSAEVNDEVERALAQ